MDRTDQEMLDLQKFMAPALKRGRGPKIVRCGDEWRKWFIRHGVPGDVFHLAEDEDGNVMWEARTMGRL